MEAGLWAIAAGVVLWILSRLPAFTPDARRVARAKRHADLLAALPPGDARDLFAFEVHEEVTRLIEARDVDRFGSGEIERYTTIVIVIFLSIHPAREAYSFVMSDGADQFDWAGYPDQFLRWVLAGSLTFGIARFATRKQRATDRAARDVKRQLFLEAGARPAPRSRQGPRVAGFRSRTRTPAAAE